MINPELLIVGAGPTGLTLANLLAKVGVDFMIIDSKEKPTQDSKAFGIHARSLEIFSQLGIAEELIAEGNIDNTFHIMSKAQEVASFKINNILPGETPYPYFLILPQHKTERRLVEALNTQGHQVHWQHQLIDLTLKNQTYAAEIMDTQGERHHISPKYIIGCDGADSTVRKKAGISFNGTSFTSPFYLADVELDSHLKHGDVYFTIAPNHLSVIFSYKRQDHFRVFNFIKSTINKKKHEKLLETEVQKILDDNSSLKSKVISKQWSSVYNIHCRMAESFVKGNVILAGDAAHVHSPVGGQGMNTGIQDSFNLAWKLKWAIKNTHSSELVNSYQVERYPVARNLHYSTDKFFQLLIKQNKIIDLIRIYFFPYVFRLLSNEFVLKFLFRRVSQIGIKYRKSPLNKNHSTSWISLSPHQGDRAPWVPITYRGKKVDLYELLDYRYFTLLLAGTTTDYNAIINLLKEINQYRIPSIKVYYFPASNNQAFYNTYDVKRAAMYLIRPDGHIGLKCNRIDNKVLERYLKDILLIT
ncbi:MAG TPA: FAD-dependent monooxygenase [Anditalea sp.]|nr:FAD-dependent monooxygenase [Anditalea sp.]